MRGHLRRRLGLVHDVHADGRGGRSRSRSGPTDVSGNLEGLRARRVRRRLRVARNERRVDRGSLSGGSFRGGFAAGGERRRLADEARAHLVERRHRLRVRDARDGEAVRHGARRVLAPLAPRQRRRSLRAQRRGARVRGVGARLGVLERPSQLSLLAGERVGAPGRGGEFLARVTRLLRGGGVRRARLVQVLPVRGVLRLERLRALLRRRLGGDRALERGSGLVPGSHRGVARRRELPRTTLRLRELRRRGVEVLARGGARALERGGGGARRVARRFALLFALGGGRVPHLLGALQPRAELGVGGLQLLRRLECVLRPRARVRRSRSVVEGERDAALLLLRLGGCRVIFGALRGDVGDVVPPRGGALRRAGRAGSLLLASRRLLRLLAVLAVPGRGRGSRRVAREFEPVLQPEGERHDVVGLQRGGRAGLDLLAVHEHAVPGEVGDGHLVLVGGLGAGDVARDHRVLGAHCVERGDDDLGVSDDLGVRGRVPRRTRERGVVGGKAERLSLWVRGDSVVEARASTHPRGRR